MSRRTTLAVLIVVVLLAAVGLVVWKPDSVASGSAEPVSVEPTSNRVDAVVDALAEDREARSVAPKAVAVPTASAPDTPEPSAFVAERPDLEAKTPLEIVVVDRDGQPVFDAAIRLDGMRSASIPGSWYGFRGEPAVARTDPRGRAKLDVWDWVDIDGRTTSVDVSVTHPEFVPFGEDAFRVGSGEHTIVLQRGAAVSVRAWHGSPNDIVEDIVIELERETVLPANAWTRESDGRMVTTRIAAGHHVLRVTSALANPGAGSLHSRIESFDVGPNERVDLSVELHAALEWTGNLDDSVPRPIVDGRVQLTLVDHFGDGQSSGCLSTSFEAEVLGDGTFTIRDLPPGRGFVFALCPGYVSKRVRAATLADAGITLSPGATPADEERAWKDLGDIVMQVQRAEVPAASPVTIEMVATGSVEVTVTRPDGTPIPNAEVYASPNVSIPHQGSTLVPWRHWQMRADARGIYRFEDVPPDTSLWLWANANGFQMSAQDREKAPSVAVISNEVSRRTIVLEPVGDVPK